MTDRERLQTLARAYDWRLTHSTAITDEFKLVHTDEVLIIARFTNQGRLDQASLYDHRTFPSSGLDTASMTEVAVWMEGTDRRAVSADVKVLFVHIDADGHGLRLERVTADVPAVEGFYLRVLDSNGMTMAATTMDRHVLDLLATTIGEL